VDGDLNANVNVNVNGDGYGDEPVDEPKCPAGLV
jgi:hypothetical protein